MVSLCLEGGSYAHFHFLLWFVVSVVPIVHYCAYLHFFPTSLGLTIYLPIAFYLFLC